MLAQHVQRILKTRFCLISEPPIPMKQSHGLILHWKGLTKAENKHVVPTVNFVTGSRPNTFPASFFISLFSYPFLWCHWVKANYLVVNRYAGWSFHTSFSYWWRVYSHEPFWNYSWVSCTWFLSGSTISDTPEHDTERHRRAGISNLRGWAYLYTCSKQIDNKLNHNKIQLIVYRCMSAMRKHMNKISTRFRVFERLHPSVTNVV